MTLYILKYLFHLIFKGEMTSSELAESHGDSIQNASNAMRVLKDIGLVRHPQNRPRSWEIVPSMTLILLLEQFLLISKNNEDLKKLLLQPSVIKIGSKLHKNRAKTILALIESTGLSKVTVIRVLNKLLNLNMLQKTSTKPYVFSISSKTPAPKFFDVCHKIERIFTDKSGTELTPERIMKNLAKDKSVLILLHYGSTARGKGDRFSDIDLLAVTRDKISRGEILDRYSHEKIDLSIYSKEGFLNLLKSHPDFVSNIAKAKVLKGKDILDAVAA